MTDLNSLSSLLGSQEARDRAPCVPVVGPWYLLRNGTLRELSEFYKKIDIWSDWRRTGSGEGVVISDECVWSGDLVTLISEAVKDQAFLEELHEKAQSILLRSKMQSYVDEVVAKKNVNAIKNVEKLPYD